MPCTSERKDRGAADVKYNATVGVCAIISVSQSSFRLVRYAYGITLCPKHQSRTWPLVRTWVVIWPDCFRQSAQPADRKSYRKVCSHSNAHNAHTTDTQWTTSTASMSPIVTHEKKIDLTLRCGAVPFENRRLAILATTKPAAHLSQTG